MGLVRNIFLYQALHIADNELPCGTTATPSYLVELLVQRDRDVQGGSNGILFHFYVQFNQRDLYKSTLST